MYCIIQLHQILGVFELRVGVEGNINIVNNIIQNNQNQVLIDGSNSSNPIKAEFISNIIGTSGDKAVLKNIPNIGNVDTSTSCR